MSVIEFEEKRRVQYAGGRQFGDTGAYEQIDGVLTFAVDPTAEVNSEIVDLHLAPTDTSGQVRFKADFTLIRPVDPEKGSRSLIVELPNRGRRRVIDTFNMSGAEPAASPDAGDGFLFERGFTVASIGWQWDVHRSDVLMGLEPPMADISGELDPGMNVVEIRPNVRQSTFLLADRVHIPLKTADPACERSSLYVKDYEDAEETLVPNDQWRFAKETEGGVEPSDEHVYMENGFEPGKFYQIIYPTNEAPIAGAGLLALRDVTSFLKYDAEPLISGGGRLDHAFAYGVSQTGRMLRHFMWLGLNTDEAGRMVFDGLLPHVGGARRGAFNHRYAQPSNQSYPNFAHMFPFADNEVDDPFSGNRDGLLSRLRQSGDMPKVISTNSSSEYWRGDCSLTHTDPLGTLDVESDPSARIYHFAGTEHGPGSLPQTRDGAPEGARGRYEYNVVDYSPLLRAALINLVRWVKDGLEPPPSSHPKFADETLVSQGSVLEAFGRLPDQVTPDRSKLWRMRAIDPGPRGSEGVGAYPSIEGETYPCFVSAVDADGNEVGGIRLPDISQPVATHTGWNVRDPETGSPDQQVPMLGFSRWFPLDPDERQASKDPRRSITDRYSDRAAYETAARSDTEELVRESYVLEEDTELVVNAALARYDYALARS